MNPFAVTGGTRSISLLAHISCRLPVRLSQSDHLVAIVMLLIFVALTTPIYVRTGVILAVPRLLVPRASILLVSFSGLSAGTGKLCISGHLGLVFIWNCFVSRLLFLLYYVLCAPVLTEGTVFNSWVRASVPRVIAGTWICK